MIDKHTNFPRIEGALHFDSKGHGPVLSAIVVVAVESPNLDMPRARIAICGRYSSISMTAHQAATLRDQLDAAIGAVVLACPQMSTPDEFRHLPKDMPRG